MIDLFPERLEDYISEDYRLHREPQGHWPPPCPDFEPAETGMTSEGIAMDGENAVVEGGTRVDDEVSSMGNIFEITDVNVTLRDVMPKLLAIDGVAADDDRGMAYWYLGPGLLHIRVPNFGWRKRAIVRHDVHHLLTGYPCTPTGEMQMAAWEFAAGRFPHPGATAFCLPLVGMGAVLSPRRTFAAFVRGRRGTSLYATPLSDEVLASRIVDLRQRFAPTVPTPATTGDWLTYLALVGLSFSLMLAPFLILTVAAFASAR